MYTLEQANKILESNLYLDLNSWDIVNLQIYEEFNVVPFDVFHRSLEDVLGRVVYEYEIANDIEELIQEFEGKKPKPDPLDIFLKVPGLRQTFINLLRSNRI